MYFNLALLKVLQDNSIITLQLLADIVIGLSKIVQSIDLLNGKFIPLVSLILGVILNLFVNGLILILLFVGLLIGLTAVGTHNGTKNKKCGRRVK